MPAIALKAAATAAALLLVSASAALAGPSLSKAQAREHARADARSSIAFLFDYEEGRVVIPGCTRHSTFRVVCHVRTSGKLNGERMSCRWDALVVAEGPGHQQVRIRHYRDTCAIP